MTTLNWDKIFQFILNKPHQYPGPHLDSQPRQEAHHKPLEPCSQFHVVTNALCHYIEDNLKAGKGVNIRNFGAFTFEMETDKVQPAQLCQYDTNKHIQENRADRAHVHKVRPCFQVGGTFETAQSRFPNKEEVSMPKSQRSVFQKGFNMTYCNPADNLLTTDIGI